MGLMFLVFTPCLYCNVSDSWMLPNKWHRVFIGAAGMYVELILASIATWLWWFSEPGMFNFLCLSVMFICSVSTVMFNGNPLLRFDGYYILMDILEIPNLRQKSTEILKRWFQQYCLGLELQENPFLPHRNKWAFALYTVAAVTYRWVVVFSITLFLINVLEPYGLQSIGRTIAYAGLVGMLVQPIWASIKFLRTPGRASKMKRKNVLTSLAVVGVLAALVAYLPLPFHVDCAVEVQPQGASQVFAMVPGRLVAWERRPGDEVHAGDVVANLDSFDVRFQQAKMLGEYEMALLRYETVKEQKFKDPQALGQLEMVAELVKSKALLLAKANERVDMLTVRAAGDGVIMPAPPKPAPKASEKEQLPTWSGNPFDAKNDQAFFAESDLLCLVGDPQRMEAVLVVDQADIDLINIGVEADMKIDSAKLETFSGFVRQISEMDMKETPESLSKQVGGQLDTEMDSSGRLRPMSTSYQARVPLEDVEIPLRAGYRGQAKIYVGWKPLGWRLYRFLAKTFSFEM